MHRTVAAIALGSCLAGAAICPAQQNPARLAAAAELVRAMKLERDIEGAGVLLVDAWLGAEASLAPHRQAMLDWVKSVMSWETVSPRLIELYATTFTESEMKEMIAFYQSRTGRKLIAEFPELMRKQAALGAELAQSRSHELERLILELGGASQESLSEYDDQGALKATVATLRTVGTAMLSWATDAMADPGRPAVAHQPSASSEPNDPDVYDWSRCSAISYAELEVLLVDTYIAELPRKDGWGRDLEFCVDQVDVGSSPCGMGVRSAGRDGAYERGGYRSGAFPVDDWDRDLVWCDGFFITWPGSPEGR